MTRSVYHDMHGQDDKYMGRNWNHVPMVYDWWVQIFVVELFEGDFKSVMSINCYPTMGTWCELTIAI